MSQLSLALTYGFLTNFFGCSFPWAIHSVVFWVFKKYFFVIFYKFYSFSLTWDPMGVKILKSYSSDKLQPKFLVLNFLRNGPHKTAFGIFEILSFQFFNDFFFQKFQIHHCTCILWRNQKPQLSGKWALVEQNGVKLGFVGSTLIYLGYLWPCSIKNHFGVIRCTFNFFLENCQAANVIPTAAVKQSAKVYGSLF